MGKKDETFRDFFFVEADVPGAAANFSFGVPEQAALHTEHGTLEH